MMRVCEKCNHVTGQRKCLYCGHGKPGSNLRGGTSQRPTVDGAVRQVARAKLFAACWKAYQSAPTAHAQASRRERRKMARAHAAGQWRKIQLEKSEREVTA